jgi:hypothetical protein
MNPDMVPGAALRVSGPPTEAALLFWVQGLLSGFELADQLLDPVEGFLIIDPTGKRPIVVDLAIHLFALVTHTSAPHSRGEADLAIPAGNTLTGPHCFEACPKSGFGITAKRAEIYSTRPRRWFSRGLARNRRRTQSWQDCGRAGIARRSQFRTINLLYGQPRRLRSFSTVYLQAGSVRCTSGHKKLRRGDPQTQAPTGWDQRLFVILGRTTARW